MKLLLFFVPRFLTHIRVLEPDKNPAYLRAVPLALRHKEQKELTLTKIKIFTFLGYIKVLSADTIHIKNPDYHQEN